LTIEFIVYATLMIYSVITEHNVLDKLYVKNMLKVSELL